MIYLLKNSKEIVIYVITSYLVTSFIAYFLRLSSLIIELLVIRIILEILFNHKTIIILNSFVIVINN